VAFEKGKTPKGAKPFKKGQSGNPAGRPEGSKNRATILRRLLETKTVFTNPLTLQKETVSLEERVMIALIARASRGDITAIKEIQDTLYGKQSNVNLNFTPEELQSLTDEEFDALYSKVSRA
jgi:hypothetical protein